MRPIAKPSIRISGIPDGWIASLTRHAERKPRKGEWVKFSHALSDSQVVLKFESWIDIDRSYRTGDAFEEAVQEVQAKVSDCDMRVFAKSFTTLKTVKGARPSGAIRDSLPFAAQRDRWYSEIESPLPTASVSLLYRGDHSIHFMPDPIDFEARYRADTSVLLALFFVGQTFIHPSQHALIFRKQGDGLYLVYSKFRDGIFRWKAHVSLDSSVFQSILQEVDFLEKASTYLLGRPDFVDAEMLAECRYDYLGGSPSATPERTRKIESECLLRSRNGVIVNKRRPNPTYLYGIQNLADDRDRRNLEDFQYRSLATLLRHLPAGEITFVSRRPAGASASGLRVRHRNG